MKLQLDKDQKAIATIIILLLVAFLTRAALQVAYGLDQSDFITYEDYKAFDFNTVTSPLMAGYTNITHATYYSANIQDGWSATCDSRDRAVGSDLLRDLNFYAVNRTFSCDVNASVSYYQISIYHGDTYEHAGYSFYVDGDLVLATSNGANEWLIDTINVTVIDGTLDLLCVQDVAGSNWVINGLDVKIGTLDNSAWLQYQIDLANETAIENFETNVALVILFFTVAVSIAVGLLYARKKK